jgi:isocitrate dehydrogenase (NAD+)
MAAHRITLIPGDGVGPEVIGAARRVLDASGVDIEWVEGDLHETRVALKGPTSTPVAGDRSYNIALRREFDLHTSIRPVRFGGVDVVIARMNGEDLYAGIEWEPGSVPHEVPSDAGGSLKYISETEARRAMRTACTWVREAGRSRATVVHKATVMRQTDGLFRDVALEEAAAAGLEADDMLVDTACGELARDPRRFDVLLAPVMYGDILSDLAAGLAGGAGIGPNANLGDDCAVFETVHGSAPRRAGKGVANPFAAILAGAMMLRHLGEDAAALNVEGAVAACAAGGVVTYDLTPERDPSRAASTDTVAESVVELLAGGD